MMTAPFDPFVYEFVEEHQRAWSRPPIGVSGPVSSRAGYCPDRGGVPGLAGWCAPTSRPPGSQRALES